MSDTKQWYPTHLRYEAATVAAIAGVVGALASTGATVYTLKQQEKASEAAAKQQESEAETAAESAAFNERQHRRKMALLLGEQRAAYAAAGLDLGGGSPLAQEIDLTTQAELEALQIRREGRIVGAERRFKASVARNQASQARANVAPAVVSGVASGTASGIRGYRSVSTDWRSG